LDNFKTMQAYVDKMQSTSKTSVKEEILRQYGNTGSESDIERNQFVQKCVYYTLNPEYMYGVTRKQCEKVLVQTTDAHEDIPVLPLFTLLDKLRNRELTGHNAIYHVLKVVYNNINYKDLIYGIIDKDIETRANATLVNKVWGKGFIPVFDVALAQTWEPGKVDYSEGYFASRKLDGLRCICKVDGVGNARFFSRKGKEFFTLNVLKEDIYNARISNVVFDGEVCIMNGDLEDFKAIHKQYKKKNHIIVYPKLKVFDILTHDEFNSGSSRMVLNRRLYNASGWFEDAKCIEAVNQVKVSSDEEVIAMLDSAERQGWEGLILRKDVGYKGKRSKDILKVKKFKEAEYKVVELEMGEMRFLENGKDVPRETMRKAVIMHKGNPVGVGSGWSKLQRQQYYNKPFDLVGETITVRYKQETVDEEGKPSLQFPTLKALHGAERDA